MFLSKHANGNAHNNTFENTYFIDAILSKKY